MTEKWELTTETNGAILRTWRDMNQCGERSISQIQTAHVRYRPGMEGSAKSCAHTKNYAGQAIGEKCTNTELDLTQMNHFHSDLYLTPSTNCACVCV